MKKYYSIPGLVLAIGFLITSYIFISKSVEHSKIFREEKSKIADILNFNDRLLTARDWLFTEKAWKEKKEQFEAVVKKADIHYSKAMVYGNYLIYTCIAFLLLMVVVYARRRIFYGLTFALSFIGLVMLGQGVMNPMLEIGAYKEELTIKVHVHADDIPYFEQVVEYMGEVNDILESTEKYIPLFRFIPEFGDSTADLLEEIVGGTQDYVEEGEKYLNDNRDSHVGFDKVFPGRMYFYYQNKGIMDVIALLWNQGNKPVAASIGAFSVIIPGIKLIFTLIMLLFGFKGGKRMRKVVSYIGKFSMADVFVIGMFLSYLSFANMSSGVDMEARTMFGLYFFMAYVLISIFLGILLDFSIKERMKIDEKEALTLAEATKEPEAPLEDNELIEGEE